MSTFTLYRYSPATLKFVEDRWCKTKLAVLAGALVLMILGAGMLANRIFSDVVGFGIQKDKALRAENDLLRDRIRAFRTRLEGLHATIGMLSDQGNELRLLVDLPKVGADTRKAGFGGTDERLDLAVPGDVNRMLNDLRLSMAKAEKELQLEQTLCREASAKYKENSKMYPSIPAIKPVDGPYSMAGFGMRFHPVYHRMLFHEGLDIASANGTPVHATGDGVVVSAGRSSTGLGTLVVINHGYGYTTVYGHLSKVLVHSGEHVRRGSLIALSGSTGVVTGPHLHYEVRFHGQLQNPVDYFFDSIGYRMFEEGQTSPQ